MQMNQLLQAVYLTGLTLLLRTFPPSGASPDAKRLYDDLLKKSGYNKLIRPVGNTTDTLTVKLGLRLTQIIDVVSTLMSHHCQQLSEHGCEWSVYVNL